MSAPTKKHPTKNTVTVQTGKKKPKLYFVSGELAEAVTSLLEAYDKSDSVPMREALKFHFDETSEQAAVLRGSRYKEEMTQKELAEKLGVAQGYVSQIEKGKRQINVSMAKKLAKIFNTHYKVFL